VRRAVALVLALVALPAVGAHAGDTASPFCTPRSAPIPQGPATLVSDRAVDNTAGRLHELTIDAPALYGQTHAYVLLPKDYDPSGTTRYPVLYLLHGAIDNYGQWWRGGVESIVDDAHLRPFITVMPDAGAWGFYSDWYGSDLDGHTPNPPPAWTQYHIHELIPLIDGHFPTDAQRSSRAIAGLSMGGFGAMSYAARFPDLFAAAGSFSGVVDPDLDYPYGNAFLTLASLYFDTGHVDQCVWGDLVTQRARWEGNDPTSLAGNLAGTSLFVASGGGDAQAPQGIAPSPDDAGDPVGVFTQPSVEETCFLMSRAFTQALDADGIAHTDDFYGSGTHSMKYWSADLRKFLPQMAAAWASPATVPPARTFDYRSIGDRFSVWGWTFTAHRDATAFTELTRVGRGGLTAAGSGTLDVVTAPLYEPGAQYTVTGGGPARAIAAGDDGRLRFAIDLGSPAVVTIAPAG
jgi:S-formylglutathione hydrolase FrmB